jgi:ketosteroid isomerase-like protein
MRHAFTLLLAVLATGSVIYGQTKNDGNAGEAKAIQELRKLVSDWDRADVAGDTTTLDRLLADEFSFVGGDNKAQYLASLKSKPADLTIESAVSTDVQVQIYGSTAIVTGLDTITGKNKGESYTNRWLYMDVWVKRSGRWQCVKTYSTLANKK